jgi:hypothetical protein
MEALLSRLFIVIATGDVIVEPFPQQSRNKIEKAEYPLWPYLVILRTVVRGIVEHLR